MIQVKKLSGQLEPFSEDKVLSSIKRIGIPQEQQQEVLKHVNSILFDGISSSAIHNHIAEFLAKSSQPFLKSKYSLREAVMNLGPSGYPFEDYIAKILEALGYATQTRTVVSGTCITHEIDVIAQKQTVIPTRIMIEAKFHNQMGLRTNVQIPMYTKARFDDCKEKNGFTQVWLVTNTKATIDAITYAQCIGMKIISWSYPEGEGLRDLVEKLHMYPVTSLTTLSQSYKQQLLQNDIVLCKDICEDITILNRFDLSTEQKKQIIDEVSFLCQKGLHEKEINSQDKAQ